jgi:AcrR family transcriptional regulator
MLTCYTIFKEYCEIFDYGVLEMAVNGDETRDRVQKCALRLFRSKGYDNVTIDDICAAAEITRSAFYYHFSTKEILFHSLYQEPFSFDLRIMAKVFNTDNCWAKFWYLHENGFNWLLDIGPEILSTILTMALSRKNKNFFPGLDMSYIDIASGIIELGQNQEHFAIKGDKRSITYVARNVMLGIMHDWCCDNGNFDLKDTMKRELTLLLQVREDLIDF